MKKRADFSSSIRKWLISGASTIILAGFYRPFSGSLLANEGLRKMDSEKGFTPESVLPAGVDSAIVTNPYTGEAGPVRKGTFAATVNNITLLNTLLTEDNSPADQIKIQKILDSIKELITSLRLIGVFNLFTPEEWLTQDDQPGRILVAILYLQKYPQEIIPKIKERLHSIQNETKGTVLAEETKKALAALTTKIPERKEGGIF